MEYHLLFYCIGWLKQWLLSRGLTYSLIPPPLLSRFIILHHLAPFLFFFLFHISQEVLGLRVAQDSVLFLRSAEIQLKTGIRVQCSKMLCESIVGFSHSQPNQFSLKRPGFVDFSKPPIFPCISISFVAFCLA